MPMNRAHRKLCSSARWAGVVEETIVPAVVDGVDLGPDVLEIGPGFGATTRVLAARLPRLTALEIDPDSVTRLRAEFDGPGVEIAQGDGTAMPFPDGRFSGVVCFTMLHHVPSPDLQDALFAEAARVLAPGGTLAGCDSRTSLRFRLLHVGDTMVVVDPATLAERLVRAGFSDPEIALLPRRVVFRARRK